MSVLWSTTKKKILLYSEKLLFSFHYQSSKKIITSAMRFLHVPEYTILQHIFRIILETTDAINFTLPVCDKLGSYLQG